MGSSGSLRAGWRRAPLSAALCVLWACAAAAPSAAGAPPQPAEPPAVGDQVGDDEQHESAHSVDPEEAAEDAAEEKAAAAETGGKSDREERRARRKARREARSREKTSGLTTDKGEEPGSLSGTLKKARTEGDSLTRPLQALETSADDAVPGSAAGLTGESGFSGTQRGPAERKASGGPGGAAGGEPPRPIPPGTGPEKKAAPPFSASPSRDPAHPASASDLVLASRSGYAPLFQAAGFKLGGDGRSIVRIADERPATEAELQSLRQGILAAPAGMAKRADYFTALPQAHYQELGRDFRERPGLAEKQFKHIAMTPDGRDFVYSASCDRMSGDCNESVGKSSYRKGESVSPEDLEKVWGGLQEELDADEAGGTGPPPSRFGRPLSAPPAGMLARARSSAKTLKDGLLDVARLLTGSGAAREEPAGPLPLGASRPPAGDGGKTAAAERAGPAAAPKSLAETFRSPERKFLLLLFGVIVALGLLWRLRD